MSTFSDEITIIRRFLRDPDGNIWSDNDIQTFWNGAQHEIASKAGYIEKVNTYKYPPEWTYSYMHDWEKQTVDGDRYQCLIPWEADGSVVCYPWESSYWLDSERTPDSGYRFANPWEGVLCGSPADVIPIPLHDRFNEMKFMAYDQDELEPTDRRKLSLEDGFYRTATGTSIRYWHPDEERNQVVPYPRPSNVTYDDGSLTDTFDDAGGIVTWEEAAIDEADIGLVAETLDTDNKFLAVFEEIPEDVSSDPGDWTIDEIDFPAFLVKYIRYGALERCFGADTDGFIPSLRDYWQARKDLGIRAIKRFKSMRRADRDYRLGGGRRRIISRHPRLPAEYPVQEL